VVPDSTWDVGAVEGDQCPHKGRGIHKKLSEETVRGVGPSHDGVRVAGANIGAAALGLEGWGEREPRCLPEGTPDRARCPP